MKTNEQYVEEINGLLTNFVKGRHGIYNVSVPDEEIKDILNVIYLSVYKMISTKRQEYIDTKVICPEWEKEYLEETE